jgi:predicted nucleic acid-binding protein
MRVYFDTCSLHRPLDSKAQLRVALEAEAILGLLGKCENGEIELISSEVLALEVERNPQPQRKAFVSSILSKAQTVIFVDTQIKSRAKELELRGFKAFDALHVASSESAKCHFFCSCDDRLLKKARQQSDISVKVVSPLELVGEVSP